jgi:Ca-activated chloride channel homolog
VALPCSCKLLLSGMLAAALAAGAEAPQRPADPRVEVVPRPQLGDRSDAGPRTRIRVDSNLVLIPVTVTDPLNRLVTGLDKESFRLFEDTVEQSVTQFSSEEVPLSVGVVFDGSGSMGQKLEGARSAVAQFFKTANPDDEFFLVQFSDNASLALPFTHDLGQIQNRLLFSQSKGRTALLDGVRLALLEMRHASNPRKAILVMSDGGDNNSRYTESEIGKLMREADVQLYAVGLYDAGMGRSPEEAGGPGLLTKLAEQSGGRQYAADNEHNLADIAAKIGVQLRHQYLLGYVPQNRERDGKYRRVQVKLNQPKGLPQLRTYWRMGYYAPSQ